MGTVRTFSLLVAGLLPFVAAAPAEAAPVSAPTPPTAKVTVNRPTAIRLLNDLNFGVLTVTTAGTATVSTSDVITTTVVRNDVVRPSASVRRPSSRSCSSRSWTRGWAFSISSSSSTA